MGVLSGGQVTTNTSKTQVLSVGSGTESTVSTFVLTNEGSTTITVFIYVNSSNTDRYLSKVVIPAGVGKSVTVPHALGTYSQLDFLKVEASTVATYNYLLTGRTDNV